MRLAPPVATVGVEGRMSRRRRHFPERGAVGA